MSPSSGQDIVLKDLIVLCPINSTTEVQSLSIQSMEPTDTTMQTSTQYAGYLYTSVNALGGLTTCTGSESPVTAGKTPLPALITAPHNHKLSGAVCPAEQKQRGFCVPEVTVPTPAFELDTAVLLQAVQLPCQAAVVAMFCIKAMRPY